MYQSIVFAALVFAAVYAQAPIGVPSLSGAAGNFSGKFPGNFSGIGGNWTHHHHHFGNHSNPCNKTLEPQARHQCKFNLRNQTVTNICSGATAEARVHKLKKANHHAAAHKIAHLYKHLSPSARSEVAAYFAKKHAKHVAHRANQTATAASAAGAVAVPNASG